MGGTSAKVGVVVKVAVTVFEVLIVIVQVLPLGESQFDQPTVEA